MLDVVVFFAYCGSIFCILLSAHTHWCCCLLCLMWWLFLRTLVYKHHCDGLLWLMLWYFLRTVVVFVVFLAWSIDFCHDFVSLTWRQCSCYHIIVSCGDDSDAQEHPQVVLDFCARLWHWNTFVKHVPVNGEDQKHVLISKLMFLLHRKRQGQDAVVQNNEPIST